MGFHSRILLPIALCLVAVWLAGSALAQTPPAAPAADTMEGITVLGHAELERMMRSFVRSYAAPAPYMNMVARWKDPVCPDVRGLSPAFNTFIRERIQKVAADVGAGRKQKKSCRPNIRVIFTPDAQGLVNQITAKAPRFLGYHFKAQEKELATVRYPIQAWYLTATEDINGFTAVDDNDAACEFFPGDTLPTSCPGFTVAGSRLGPHLRSEFAAVTVIVDFQKIVGIGIGSLADYISMLALSQTKAYGACRNLPSITNLMATDCSADVKADALTNNDLAYLKALYQMNPTGMPELQPGDIAKWMTKDLEHP